MKTKTSFIIFGIIANALVANAQDFTIRPYVGVTTDYILLTGSFDGKSVFLTDKENILVPKLKPSPGFGVLFGVTLGNGAIDFAYHISRMEYTSLADGFSGTSTTHLIRYLGYKGYFKSFIDKKVRLYLDVDLSLAFSHFEKISYLISNQSQYNSANYGGIIFGTGIGSQINLIKNLALNFEILPELYLGTDIRSKNSKRYQIKKFTNFLLVNSVGLNYYFKSNRQ
jgi:hypothetical protein